MIRAGGRLGLVGITGALSALVPGASVSAAGDHWVRFAQDGEGSLFYNRATMKREGDRVRYTLRAVVTGAAARTLIGEQEMDCAKQTNALLSAREFGAGAEPLRSVTVPADRVQREPLFAGDQMASLYRLLCPRGAPLPKRQPAPPPVQVIPTTP